MPQGDTQAQNHPQPGSSIKVDPIRDRADIARIKAALADQPRNLCLFTLGINTAYRASELLSLRVGQVAHLRAGDRLEIRQGKTGAHRSTTVNGVVVEALQLWLSVHPAPGELAPLFMSNHWRRGALSVPAVSRLVKRWCREAALHGNFGSHSLRKTWGYHQRTEQGAPVALLMSAYGHASERQTLEYLGIQDAEIEALYAMEL